MDTGSLVLQSAGSDLQMLYMNSGSGDSIIARFDSAGTGSIRYHGVEKLATTSTGIDVTGTAGTNDGI